MILRNAVIFISLIPLIAYCDSKESKVHVLNTLKIDSNGVVKWVTPKDVKNYDVFKPNRQKRKLEENHNITITDFEALLRKLLTKFKGDGVSTEKNVTEKDTKYHNDSKVIIIAAPPPPKIQAENTHTGTTVEPNDSDYLMNDSDEDISGYTVSSIGQKHNLTENYNNHTESNGPKNKIVAKIGDVQNKIFILKQYKQNYTRNHDIRATNYTKNEITRSNKGNLRLTKKSHNSEGETQTRISFKNTTISNDTDRNAIKYKIAAANTGAVSQKHSVLNDTIHKGVNITTGYKNIRTNFENKLEKHDISKNITKQDLALLSKNKTKHLKNTPANHQTSSETKLHITKNFPKDVMFNDIAQNTTTVTNPTTSEVVKPNDTENARRFKEDPSKISYDKKKSRTDTPERKNDYDEIDGKVDDLKKALEKLFDHVSTRSDTEPPYVPINEESNEISALNNLRALSNDGVLFDDYRHERN